MNVEKEPCKQAAGFCLPAGLQFPMILRDAALVVDIVIFDWLGYGARYMRNRRRNNEKAE